MTKFIATLAFVLLSTFSINTIAAQHHHTKSYGKEAQGTVDLYFFWSNDCPHCVAAHPFIEKLKAEYSWLNVREFEISNSPKNAQLFEKMARDHGKATSFVPTFFVKDKMIVGYTSADTTGEQIRAAVLASH
jgi:thiol-disulfide isomerase/thioredoxin